MGDMMLFDLAHFSHMTGGDAALQREVIGLFRGQAAIWTEALQADGKWRDTAHTIKGSARGIGLWALAQACEAAEAVNEGDAAQIEAALNALHAALADALAALDGV